MESQVSEGKGMEYRRHYTAQARRIGNRGTTTLSLDVS